MNTSRAEYKKLTSKLGSFTPLDITMQPYFCTSISHNTKLAPPHTQGALTKPEFTKDFDNKPPKTNKR